MQRKMKLIYKLLEHLERRHDDDPIPLPEVDGYSEEQVHYQVGLSVEAGYLVAGAATSTSEGRRFATLERLTWAGHEALDQKRRGQHGHDES